MTDQAPVTEGDLELALERAQVMANASLMLIAVCVEAGGITYLHLAECQQHWDACKGEGMDVYAVAVPRRA